MFVLSNSQYVRLSIMKNWRSVCKDFLRFSFFGWLGFLIIMIIAITVHFVYPTGTLPVEVLMLCLTVIPALVGFAIGLLRLQWLYLLFLFRG